MNWSLFSGWTWHEIIHVSRVVCVLVTTHVQLVIFRWDIWVEIISLSSSKTAAMLMAVQLVPKLLMYMKHCIEQFQLFDIILIKCVCSVRMLLRVSTVMVLSITLVLSALVIRWAQWWLLILAWLCYEAIWSVDMLLVFVVDYDSVLRYDAVH